MSDSIINWPRTDGADLPRALFSCSNQDCRENTAHYAEDLYWFAYERRWVCAYCWDDLPTTVDDDDDGPRRGVTLAEYIRDGDFKASAFINAMQPNQNMSDSNQRFCLHRFTFYSH